MPVEAIWIMVVSMSYHIFPYDAAEKKGQFSWKYLFVDGLPSENTKYLVGVGGGRIQTVDVYMGVI